ncbi:F-box/kelch-repeat protein At5g15710-like [Actinidia eriantha]|uniref:F-box/kelch-repeat protein At5g15710-like n=1 Tax=Actinidia eriantha TaxID=165200 RepID=UPI002586745C|nr:F-box/kelch-repeat protein At5g15710-like [Actinidia eriantha]
MAIKHELPQDLLMEILSRLPVRSILRFRSVSKFWFSLVRNPIFIALHHNHSKNKKCYFVSRLPKLDFSDYVFSLVLDESLVEDIKMPFTGFNLRHIKLYASSSGLLCLVDFSYYPHKFVICNLAMKEFRVLPEPFYSTMATKHLWFMFDPNTNDYKVLRVANIYEYDINPNVKYDSDCTVPVEQKVHVYDLSTDSWREVDAILPKNFTWASTLKCLESLNGFVYWLVDGEIAIIGFRLFDELFEEIPVPDDVCWVNVELLCALNDSLALIFDTGTGTNPIRLDIWVMGEYRVKESWTKKYTIGPSFGGYFYTLGLWPKDEFIFWRSKDKRMVSYYLIGDKMKEHKLYDNLIPGFASSTLQVLPYTECLISVKRRVD